MAIKAEYLERLALITLFTSDSKESEELRQTIYDRFNDVAEAFGSNPIKKNIIKGNPDTFKVLCYEPIFLTALTESRNRQEFLTLAAKSADLKQMFRNAETAQNIIQEVSELIGYSGEALTRDQVNAGLMNYSASTMEPNPLDEEDNIPELYDDTDGDIADAPLKTESESESSESDDDDLDDYFADEEEDGGASSSLLDDNFRINEEISDILNEDASEEDGTEDIKYDPEELAKSRDLSEKQGKIETTDETSADDSMDSEKDKEIDTSDVEFVADIEEIVAAVMNRNEAVFRSCLELDRPYGMLYEKGLLTYKVVDGTLRYIPGVGKGTSVFENLYKAIIKGTSANLITAPSLRNVPNTYNIEGMGANYYPGYIFKYALGLIDGKRYTAWPKFQSALKETISTRFKQMYKKDIFFENLDKVEKVFSNAILVLSYESGAGIKLRVSLPGISINTASLESAIRTVTTYKSAGITITQVSGYQDVVDVQVLLKEDQFLDRPYWAYKAMRMKIDNGEKISLSDGLPIGRRVNGDIVEFKLDPSSRFLTFLAAGSGAGKGVLTLSLVAAAIGSGVPMFYMDFKPDMAPIFWDIEKQFNIPTFTYDGMVLERPNSTNPSHRQGFGMPDEVRKELGKFGGAILYLKCVQLMCAMAQYRADKGANDDIMFVFDETQAMQRLIKSAVEKTVEIKKKHAPKKVKGVEEEPDSVYLYVSTLLDWFKEVNVNIDTYVNTTGRKSNTFCIFIAQSPDYSTWNNLKIKTDDGQIELLSRITFADTIFKILGRGSTTSKYGLGGDGKKSVTPKELQYVANNRFFGMYDGKTTDGADITIFKPFLTLNSDNPLDKCWTKGMGKKFGSGSVPDEQYIKNLAVEHPGEPGFSNQYGVHTGTGLLGLTNMYCGGDMGKVTNGFRSGWDYCQEFFSLTGLNQKYSEPSDYMYDTSLDGLMMVGNMVAYNPANENSVLKGISEGQQGEEDSDGEINTGEVIPELEKPSQQEDSETIATDELDIEDVEVPKYGEKVSSDSDEVYNDESRAFEAYKNQLGNENSLFEPVESAYGSWEEVPQEELDNLMESMMDDAPSGADPLEVISSLLQQDVAQGYTDPITAEALARKMKLVENGFITDYDYMNNELITKEHEKQVRPVYVDKNATSATESFGKNGRQTRVDTSRTRNFTRLSDENSVDCRMAGPGELSALEKVMLGTYKGSEKYINKIWKSILSSVVSQGYTPATISRVSLYGGQMYVNNKILILDGVLGGRQNIRLRDIVDFRTMFKKYPMIRELRLDEEMIQASLAELGEDSIFKMFKLANKLEVIYIKVIDGSTQKCTRQTCQSEQAQKILRTSQMENDIDMYCKSKSTNTWDSTPAGDNIWGMKLAKSSMSRAGEAFMDKNKPSIGKTLLYGTVGIVGGAVGFGLWGIVKGAKGIFSLGKGFKR